MVLLDALHLHTIFANVSNSIKSRGATKDALLDKVEALSGAPYFYKEFAAKNLDILLKGRALISEDLDEISQEISMAFENSDAKLLEEITQKHGKTMAIVLAVSRARWENQKSLWQYMNEHQKGDMRPHLIDTEIAKIDELAVKLKLKLPIL